MPNFLLAYSGTDVDLTTRSAEETAASMEVWGAWFGTLGAAIVDMGAPFGPSALVKADGSRGDRGPAGLGGYSVISADSLADACDKAKGCPILSGGGQVEVYEALAM